MMDPANYGVWIIDFRREHYGELRGHLWAERGRVGSGSAGADSLQEQGAGRPAAVPLGGLADALSPPSPHGCGGVGRFVLTLTREP